MSAADYKTIRESLKKTQVELAQELGIESSTVAGRELGAIPISKEAEIAIKSVATVLPRRRSKVMFF